MKKILYIITFSVLLTFSCSDLEDLNQNIKDPASVPGETLFLAAQNRLADQMFTPNVNMNIMSLVMQFTTEVTYTDESNYDFYDRSIAENHARVLYRNVLKDLDEAAKVITATEYVGEDPAVKANKLAIIEVHMVYAWAVLVESFGNIPYTEALDIDNLTPVYDDAQTIYEDLLARLTTAIATLDDGHGSFDADNIYDGDVSLWNRFANSLKLRMGLVLADVNPTLSATMVNQAVAGAGGLISSNAENALYLYGSSVPNTNPMYDNYIASGRNDFVPSLTIVDPMNAMNDPRRPFYFTMYGGAYVGGENGVENSFATLSHVADDILLPNAPGNFFDYAEVEFLLAEAAARAAAGGPAYSVAGDAASHYEAAIRASIDYWGATTAEADAYLVQPEVAYATATGTWQQRIGEQKYIALYLRGFDMWTSYRMLDFPVLVEPPDALSGFPMRLPYDIMEQTLNQENWEAASAAIGGDVVETRLFFDLN